MWKSFFEHVAKLLEEVKESQGEKLNEAGALVAKSVESDGIIHTFGAGHASLVAQEVFCRPGCIVPVNAILDPSFLLSFGALRSSAMERTPGSANATMEGYSIRTNDVGIIISNSGKNSAPVEMAIKMQDMGAKVIAITSLKHSENVVSNHPSKKRLFEVADVVLDNLTPPGDASFEVPGVNAPMGATSGIVGSIIIHSIFIEAANILSEKGKPPVVFIGAQVDVGRLEGLGREVMKYKGRIKHF